MIYQGVTIQGQKIVPIPASPSDGRPHLKRQKVFGGASLRIEYVCAMPSREKVKLLLILKKGLTVLPQGNSLPKKIRDHGLYD